MVPDMPFLRHFWIFRLFILLPITLLSACMQPNGAGSSHDFDNVDIVSLQISHPDEISEFANLRLGQDFSLSAIATYSDGKNEKVTDIVEWRSSNLQVLSVSKLGVLSTHSVGKSTITARLNDISQSVELVIDSTEIQEMDLDKLSSITITPTQKDLPLGLRTAVTATGIFEDGTSRDITSSVFWSSKDETVVEVSNNLQNTDFIIGKKLGTSVLTAEVGDLSSTVSIQVTEAQLININIENDTNELIKDTSVIFSAWGIFSDGSKVDVSHQVTWSSSNNSIAAFQVQQAVSTNEIISGLLIPSDVGEATIRASLNNVSQTVNVKVYQANLESLHVDSSAISLIQGTSIQLSVSGIFTNGVVQDVSHLVDFRSDDETIVSTSDSGVISGLNSGVTQLHLGYKDVFLNMSAEVSEAEIISIQVSHQTSDLATDTVTQLIATGIYNNNTHRDITENVLWASNDESILFVSNASGHKGFAYSLGLGNSEVSASIGSVSGSTIVTVSGKRLESISILSDGVSEIAAGNRTKIRAVGNYSDGSVLDITKQVVWQSSTHKVCTISSSKKNAGQIKAKNPGECQITANLGVSATGVFSITDAELMSINVSSKTSILSKGTQTYLTATGIYSNQSSVDITHQVLWKSDSDIATISNETESKGLLTAIAEGQVTYSAQYKSISASNVISISSAILEKIDVNPVVEGVFNLGTKKSFSATGYYSDSSTQDLTKQVLWVSSDSTIAQVSNDLETAGVLTSLVAGEFDLSASFDGVKSASVAVNVVDDPTAPVSISSLATPFVILNDGMDESIVTLNLKAAGEANVVADGTLVKVSLLGGEADLDSNVLLSKNGQVSFSLSSTVKGLVTIKVEIEGTEISQTISVYVTDNFGKTIAAYAIANGSLVNGLVKENSKIGLLVLNYINRPFRVEGFRVFNGDIVIAETSSPDVLNNNSLDSGKSILVTYATTQPLKNEFVAVYYLTEEKTGQQFVVAAGFRF